MRTTTTKKVLYLTDSDPLQSTCIGFKDKDGSLSFMWIKTDNDRFFHVSYQCILTLEDNWVDFEAVSNFADINLLSLDYTDEYNVFRLCEAVYSYYGSQASQYFTMSEEEFIALLKDMKLVERPKRKKS